jgi:hypothetical protein
LKTFFGKQVRDNPDDVSGLVALLQEQQEKAQSTAQMEKLIQVIEHTMQFIYQTASSFRNTRELNGIDKENILNQLNTLGKLLTSATDTFSEEIDKAAFTYCIKKIEAKRDDLFASRDSIYDIYNKEENSLREFLDKVTSQNNGSSLGGL